MAKLFPHKQAHDWKAQTTRPYHLPIVDRSLGNIKTIGVFTKWLEQKHACSTHAPTAPFSVGLLPGGLCNAGFFFNSSDSHILSSPMGGAVR